MTASAKTLRALYDSRNDFVPRLIAIHHEAHRRGLYATGHILHEAVRKVGWELAEQITRAAALKRKRTGRR